MEFVEIKDKKYVIFHISAQKQLAIDAQSFSDDGQDVSEKDIEQYIKNNIANKPNKFHKAYVYQHGHLVGRALSVRIISGFLPQDAIDHEAECLSHQNNKAEVANIDDHYWLIIMNHIDAEPIATFDKNKQ